MDGARIVRRWCRGECPDSVICWSAELALSFGKVPGFDETIEPSHPDFKTSGLKAPSLIRLGFLAVLPVNSFLGTIGSISGERHQRLLSRLCEHLYPKGKI
jgi:hypothetical protein